MTRFRLTGYSDGSVESEIIEDVFNRETVEETTAANTKMYDEWLEERTGVASPLSEALDLLSAVTQSDGKVSDVLWNQIQAFLRKVG